MAPVQPAILGRFIAGADDRTLERMFANRLALRVLFGRIAARFEPSRAGGFSGELQCDVRRSGGEPCSWTIAIAGDQAVAHRGPASEPSLVATVNAADLVRLLAGELDPASALLIGKLDVRGDFRLLMRVGRMFGGGRDG